jgi:acetylornithine deacetylase
MVDLLGDWAESVGFSVDIRPVADAPGKFNLVAVMGKGAGGLVLAGHTDTVPFNAELWSHEPLGATFEDGRVYGLGASDMKGFFALALEAAVRAPGLRAPLVLVATADEESTMSGARALAASGLAGARQAVIGEPTGLRPVRAHKGIMMESLKVTGRSGHSSDPSLGLNAIEGMQRVLGALAEWREELSRSHRDAAFTVPQPTMNFGHIHGGDNPNRICQDCELHLDLRPLPGMDIEALRDELRMRASAALDGTGFTLAHAGLFGGVPAMQTAADASIVRATEHLTGYAAETAAFATEAPYFQALGAETVVLGPGDIAQAHQPDEYLSLDRIEPMAAILDGLITRYCVDPMEDLR